MAQVRPGRGNNLSVTEHSHVAPHHLLVPEGRPSVPSRFLLELFECATLRSHEEGEAGHGVVKYGFAPRLFLEKVGAKPIARGLRIMSVVGAYRICRAPLGPPPQVRLRCLLRASVAFLGHKRTVPSDEGAAHDHLRRATLLLRLRARSGDGDQQ
eukprot:CAMPEP_0181381900 /NCGR_PEP_ID=MMETSP1106-20121128/20402_1 /TAXON_ID=81844 /ORGANISM="Mantoniella antarctica, Strain SL-175" /LENGTH=154 /DNA_ID=CAMNT_0023501183 /DNA_START=23 /DNA_END=484 /DNA_ORIENTATION=+